MSRSPSGVALCAVYAALAGCGGVHLAQHAPGVETASHTQQQQRPIGMGRGAGSSSGDGGGSSSSSTGQVRVQQQRGVTARLYTLSRWLLPIMSQALTRAQTRCNTPNKSIERCYLSHHPQGSMTNSGNCSRCCSCYPEDGDWVHV